MFDIMKKAQELQSKMEAMQQELSSMEIEGESGAGMVKVTLNGKGDMKGIAIDKSLFNASEADIIEDLIIAAHQDAKVKVAAMAEAKMKEATGDLPIPPGMNLF